jgi:hypothetical protein
MESAPDFEPPAPARNPSVVCVIEGCRPDSLKLPM